MPEEELVAAQLELGQASHPYSAGGIERQPPIFAWHSEVTHAAACSASVEFHRQRAAATVALTNLVMQFDSDSAVCVQPVG